MCSDAISVVGNRYVLLANPKVVGADGTGKCSGKCGLQVPDVAACHDQDVPSQSICYYPRNYTNRMEWLPG